MTTQESSRSPRARLRRESGVALPTALLAVVMLALLATAIWVSTDAGARSTHNREDATRAMQLAEAGASHALALIRNELADTSFTRLLLGSDGLPLTSDDGRLTGYGLSSSLQIPSSGVTLSGGRYTVQIVNDPADPASSVVDTNDRIVLRCTGTTPRGGSATVDAMIAEATAAPSTPLILVDGPMTINGNPELLGTCGAIHTNEDIVVNGKLVVSHSVSASGDASVSGSIQKPDGSSVTPLESQPALTVEDIANPLATHCADADYVLQSNGWILRTSDNTLYDAGSTERFGWKRSGTNPTLWNYGSNAQNPGTFCVHGNAKVSGSPGQNDANPVSMSIIASGSIEVSGNPHLAYDSSTGYLFLAGGDLTVSGNPQGSNTNYTGAMYARHQCEFNGNMRTSSEITCKNLTGGIGIKNLVDENKISGNPVNSHDCVGGGGGGSHERSVLSWFQRFGS